MQSIPVVFLFDKLCFVTIRLEDIQNNFFDKGKLRVTWGRKATGQNWLVAGLPNEKVLALKFYQCWRSSSVMKMGVFYFNNKRLKTPELLRWARPNQLARSRKPGGLK